MKRIYSLLLLVSAFCLTASAQSSKQKIDVNNWKDTYLLKTGVYIIDQNFTFNMNDRGFRGPAMKVEEGATVTLIIPKDVKLTLHGSHAAHASNGIPASNAFPGILLPESSTLILKGGGILEVYGGNGILATSGQDGGNAKVSVERIGKGKSFYGGYAGQGNVGGIGSYGNAPGIGTAGGKGGNGGARPVQPATTKSHQNAERDEFKGGNGDDGEASACMGKLYVFGSIDVKTHIGGNDYRDNIFTKLLVLSQTSGYGGKCARFESGTIIVDRYLYGGGGGGGNGGVCFTCIGIGSGAPGAGGGGAGGDGGVDYGKKSCNMRWYIGHKGIGGDGDIKGRNGIDGNSKDYCVSSTGGGKSGQGGKIGVRGSNGYVYYSGTTTFWSPDKRIECIDKYRSWDMDNIEYPAFEREHKDVLNRMTGFKWNDGTTTHEDLLCYQNMMINKHITKVIIPEPIHENSYFMGYQDQYGNIVFDEKGELNITLANSSSEDAAYIKDAYGNWYFNSYDDIHLTALWKDSVTVVVRHVIEDAECNDNTHKECFNHNNTVITSIKRIPVNTQEFEEGKYQKITVSAFKDIDGNIIDSLNHKDMYSLYGGDQETAELYLDKTIVYKDFRYLRQSYNLKWDCSDICTAEEFEKNLKNSDYTKAGEVKCGKVLSYPILRPVRGKMIDGWTPEHVNIMPSSNTTLKAVAGAALFSIKDSVGRGSTECELHMSATDSVLYNQKVTVSTKLQDGTHLIDLRAVTATDSVSVPLTKVSETEYTFNMPDDHVVLMGEFVLTKHSIKEIKSTRKDDTHIALLDDDNGKLYSDDPAFFGMKEGDDNYGGKIADFEVYRSKDINILAMLDQNDGTKDLRPTVTVSRDGSTEDILALARRYDVYGRERKVMTYRAQGNGDITINVQWNSQTAKSITMKYPISVKLQGMTSDCSDNILVGGTDKHSAEAYAEDFVTMKVSSNKYLSTTYITSVCSDAKGRQLPVDMTVVADSTQANNYLCRFIMPPYDTQITISFGDAVAVNLDLPVDPWNVYVPDSAVVGSTIPFAVIIPHDIDDKVQNKMIKHPTGLYDNDSKIAESTPFENYEAGENLNSEIRLGSFVVPDDNLMIRNGIYLLPQTYGKWFTFFCDEMTTLPDFIEVYNIDFSKDSQLNLTPSATGNDVLAQQPVLCHVIDNMLMSDGNALQFFLPSDPNPDNYGYVQPTNGMLVIGNLVSVTCEEILKNHDEGQKVYRLDYDSELGTPYFTEAAKDYVIDAYTVYMVGNYSGPIIPTGIKAIGNDNTDRSAPQYNIMGMRVDDSYNGVVIRGGKKMILK